MISAQRIRFSWPTVESTWDEIAKASDPQFWSFTAWKGRLAGAIFIRALIAIYDLSFILILLVPRFPMGFRLVGVYGGGRAFLVRWLLWEFYFGPKPLTVVTVESVACRRFASMMRELLAAREIHGGALSDEIEAHIAGRLDEQWQLMSEEERNHIEKMFALKDLPREFKP